MKYQITAILLSLFLTNTGFGQDNSKKNFIEFGVQIGQFIESPFLENSSYNSQLSNRTELAGWIASPIGSTYAAKLRYGRNIESQLYVIGEIGYATRNEEVDCFCHLCDKGYQPPILTKVNSLDIGIGARYEYLTVKDFNFLVEGISHYSFSTNELNRTNFLGYRISPVMIAYVFSESLSANLKYSFEQSFGDYKKAEQSLELAVNYRF